MRKSLMLVVVLLAIASLMGAMAYNTATVTNAGTLKVKNTNQSLLALMPCDGIGNKDLSADIVDGDLVFDFSKGMNGNSYGLQRNSTYVWDVTMGHGSGLFKLQQKSEDAVEVSVKVENVPEEVKVYLKPTSGCQNANGGDEWIEATDGNYKYMFKFAAGRADDGKIGVKIEVGEDAANCSIEDMNFVVKGEAIEDWR